MQRDLVLRAKKGDSDSFYTLVKEEKESLYRLAYSFSKNEEDALDIVQEAVYKAFLSIKNLKQPEYFSTWLYRITINCSKDFLSKSKKVLYIENNTLEKLTTHTERCDEIIDLKKALEDLDVKYKTVIILRFFEGLTLKEISEVLESPLNTVKTRLYRGLDILKINLEEVESNEG